VSALNEPQSIDFNPEKENRNLNSRKKNPCHQFGKDVKPKLLRNTEYAYRTFKRGTNKP